MKIGELATRAGCDTPTIRYYERERVLQEPPRTDSGYRHYTQQHLDHLNFVLHCRSVGITLAEIRLLQQYQADPTSACQGVNALLDQHVARIHQQIEAMHRLEQQLIALRQSCEDTHHHTVQDCGILQSLMTGPDDHACACHSPDVAEPDVVLQGTSA
jgi:Cd(II)/Pb(II)-responsive transcriptional regulator